MLLTLRMSHHRLQKVPKIKKNKKVIQSQIRLRLDENTQIPQNDIKVLLYYLYQCCNYYLI